MEMLRPPYWLTSQHLDRLHGVDLESFDEARQEFMAEFRQQEKLITSDTTRSVLMEGNWTRGSFWFFHALESTKGMYNLFKQHMKPRFSTADDFPDISPYWDRETSPFLRAKLEEREVYLQQLTLAASTADSDSDADADTDGGGPM